MAHHRPVLYDIAIPNARGDAATMIEVAREAERLGFRGAWVIDHLLPPRDAQAYTPILEALTSLAYLAAATTRIRLGTSVLVLPLREPVLVAKQAATIDVLSGGRLVLGVAAGHLEPEFANLHADFASRGERTDEAIRLLRHLWSGSPAPFRGEHYDYRDGVFAPLPLQARLPLMVGGFSAAALRRAATYGDIWQSDTLGPDRYRERLAELRALPGGSGLEVGARGQMPDDPRHVREVVRLWEEAGAQHLAISFGRDITAIARMRAFARAVGLS